MAEIHCGEITVENRIKLKFQLKMIYPQRNFILFSERELYVAHTKNKDLENNLNKDVDLVIKDALKEELKEDILGSAKYAKA